MRLAPPGWTSLFADQHRIEYQVIINNEDYSNYLQSNPVITKPFLDKPTIGLVCSATMTVTIRPIEGITIPKAARVLVNCRLKSWDGTTTVTNWVPLGKFNISSRSGSNSIILTCRDDMVKAGQPYLAQSSFQAWPVQQRNLVNDIVRIMGIELDDRSEIRTGEAYNAQSPGTEPLISEVLSYIGVCQGGSWIITEQGKLRLVKLESPSSTIQQVIGSNHFGFTPNGIDITVSRVTLTDGEDVTYTAGNDTGYEVTGYSPYTNQTVVNNLLTALSGVVYRPCRIEHARINPLLELGDTVSVIANDGNPLSIILHSMEVTCNVEYTGVIESAAEQDGEEEFPFQTPQDLAVARSIRADRTYYGASLNRGDGLLIQKLRGDAEIAKVRLNADEMCFYQGSQRILYFDATEGEWILNGSVHIETVGGENTTTISDINGRSLEVKTTLDGVTVTQIDEETHQRTTLIKGGSIRTDDLYLHRLFPQNGFDSYVEMMENGLNFILGQSQTLGIGYYSAEVPQPYMIFGTGTSPRTDGVGMIKKYADGIWIGDSVDRDKANITRGTGIFIDANHHKIYKYYNGTSAELADTSNVVAVFG